MKKIINVVSGLLLIVMVVISAPQAEAYTSSNAAKIAELQATIYRLQAELARIQGYNSSASTAGDVRVVGRDSVEMRSVVPGYGSNVYAWFEYGPTYSMQYSTPLTTSDAGRTFTGIADDIDSNRTYYYRAVTETRSGQITEGVIRTFKVTSFSNSSSRYDDDDYSNEDAPEVTTDDAEDVSENRAELYGEVDMQDFEDGIVFFVYGEDEDMVEDVEDEDMYSDVDTDGDDLQKVKVASRFDGDDDFMAVVTGLDEDTDHYFRLCVEYEDEDNDERLVCGNVESFETDY